jgi:thioredoxin-related protein|tara:strand:+ start:61 stop:183 length:123 start_codon:yes stop_codon:yes gene_type:complete
LVKKDTYKKMSDSDGYGLEVDQATKKKTEMPKQVEEVKGG